MFLFYDKIYAINSKAKSKIVQKYNNHTFQYFFKKAMYKFKNTRYNIIDTELQYVPAQAYFE